MLTPTYMKSSSCGKALMWVSFGLLTLCSAKLIDGVLCENTGFYTVTLWIIGRAVCLWGIRGAVGVGGLFPPVTAELLSWK